jgi:two-component system, sensor histidine kinase and response regulator
MATASKSKRSRKKKAAPRKAAAPKQPKQPKQPKYQPLPTNICCDVLDNIPQNLYCTDLLGRVVYANQQYCQTLGKAPKQILGKTAFDFFPKELAEKYTRDDQRVIRSGRIWDMEEINKPPMQEAIHVRVVKSPLRDERGKIIGVQGSWWDVSDQRNATVKIAEQAYFLNILMEHLPDNVYFKDAQGRFIRVSRAMAKHVGKSDPSELIGKTDFDFFDNEHAQAALDDELQVMQSGKPLIDKEEMEHLPDGSVSWVSTTKVPLRDNDGNIVGTFGVSRDITLRKRAEQDKQQK